MRKNVTNTTEVVPLPQLSLDDMWEDTTEVESIIAGSKPYSEATELVPDESKAYSNAPKLPTDVTSGVPEVITPAVVSEGIKEDLKTYSGKPQCEVFRNGKRVFVTYAKSCVPIASEIASMLRVGLDVRLVGVKVKKSHYIK